MTTTENASKGPVVYLLHFDRPLRGIRHYTGVTTDLRRRIEAHALGRSGARTTKQFIDAGIGFVVARTWAFEDQAEARKYERVAKRRWSGEACPICRKQTGRGLRG